MIYRAATDTDVNTLHGLLHQMAAEAGRTIAVSEATLRTHGFGAEQRFRAVLAEAEGAASGFALFYPEYSSWRGAVGLYVQDLYVCPRARGAGVARALLGAALDAASDWSATYVTLMVDHRNDAAQVWYARQGFVLRERGDLLILEGSALKRITQDMP